MNAQLLAHEIILRGDHGPHAGGDVSGHFRYPVRRNGVRQVHDAGVVQQTAGAGRCEEVRQLVQASRRLVHPATVRRQSRHVGHGAHLDLRLGAVAEGVVHLRVQTQPVRRVSTVAEPFQGLIGIPVAVGRVEARASSHGYRIQAQRRGPVEHLHDRDGLVAGCERIHHALPPRLARQGPATAHVRFHRDHHHVTALAQRCPGIAGRNVRNSSRVHEHLDGSGRQRFGVGRQRGGSRIHGRLHRGRALAALQLVVRPAGGAQGLGAVVRVGISHRREPQAVDLRDLRRNARPKPPGARQPHRHGTAGRRARLQSLEQKAHHLLIPSRAAGSGPATP